MKTSAIHIAMLLCAATLVSSCGTTRRSEPIIGDHEPANEDVSRGLVAFDTYCSACHPGGEAGLGPALNDKPLPDFAIKFQVREGLGAMPAFPEEVISEEQLDDITAYLIWLRHTP